MHVFSHANLRGGGRTKPAIVQVHRIKRESAMNVIQAIVINIISQYLGDLLKVYTSSSMELLVWWFKPLLLAFPLPLW